MFGVTHTTVQTTTLMEYLHRVQRQILSAKVRHVPMDYCAFYFLLMAEMSFHSFLLQAYS